MAPDRGIEPRRQSPGSSLERFRIMAAESVCQIMVREQKLSNMELTSAPRSPSDTTVITEASTVDASIEANNKINATSFIKGGAKLNDADCNRGSPTNSKAITSQSSWVAQEAKRHDKKRNEISKYRRQSAQSQAFHLSSNMDLVAILAWIRLFPALSAEAGVIVTIPMLNDPKVALAMLNVAEEIFGKTSTMKKKPSSTNDAQEIWTAFSALFAQTLFELDIACNLSKNTSSISLQMKLLSMFLSYAVSDQCSQDEICIERILSLPKSMQQYLFNIIQNYRRRSSSLSFEQYDTSIPSLQSQRDEEASCRQEDSSRDDIGKHKVVEKKLTQVEKDEGSSHLQKGFFRDEINTYEAYSAEILTLQNKVVDRKLRQVQKDKGSSCLQEDSSRDETIKHGTHDIEVLALKHKAIDRELKLIQKENKRLLDAAKQRKSCVASTSTIAEDKREEISTNSNSNNSDRETKTRKGENNELLQKCDKLEQKCKKLEKRNEELEDDLEATTSNLEVTTKVLGYLRTKFSKYVNGINMAQDTDRNSKSLILDSEERLLAGVEPENNHSIAKELETISKELNKTKEELDNSRLSEQKLQNRLQETAEAADRIHSELIKERTLLEETKAELAKTEEDVDSSRTTEQRLKNDLHEISKGKEKIHNQLVQEQELLKETKAGFETENKELNQRWSARMNEIQLQMKEERVDSMERGKQLLKESTGKAREIIKRLENELQGYKKQQDDNSSTGEGNSKTRYRAKLNNPGKSDKHPWN